ncbi:MAG: hypothetical protein MJE68_20855, partial [Proteobacteria bacterium]|nr:hypothetical protein [Pseudomonadota bacterium]
KVFPNGTGEGAGTHISMFVLVVTGEFDKLLTWPFCGSITVHLINQRKNGRNVVHMGWGTFKLISHAELGEEAGPVSDREGPSRLRVPQEQLFIFSCLEYCNVH